MALTQSVASSGYLEQPGQFHDNARSLLNKHTYFFFRYF